MKLLKTQYGQTPEIYGIMFIESNGTSITFSHFDKTGAYKETIEAPLKAGDYKVDKKDLYNALDVIKDPVFDIKNNQLVISNDKNKIAIGLNTSDADNINYEISENWKELPSTFIDNFKEASKYAATKDKRLALNFVNINDGNICSTNAYMLYKSFNIDLKGINATLSKEAFDTLTDPTEYQMKEDKFIVKKGSKIAVLKMYDGDYPELTKLLKEAFENAKEISYDFGSLNESVKKISKMDKKKFILSKDKCSYKDSEFDLEFDAIVDIPEEKIFTIEYFLTINGDGQVFIYDKGIIFQNEQETRLLLQRVA